MEWVLVIIFAASLIFFAVKWKQEKKISQHLISAEVELRQLKEYVKLMEYTESLKQELDEAVTSMNNEIRNKRKERNALEKLLRDLKDKISTNEQNLITIAQQKDFAAQSLDDCLAQLNSWQQTNKEAINRARSMEYGNGLLLGLSEREIFEIKKLKEVTELLVNPLAINKVIYEVYLRDKIKRLVEIAGVAGKTGIYRIYELKQDGGEALDTELPSNATSDSAETGNECCTVQSSAVRCYVGKSVNIGERWATHLKRLIGADEATREVFYREAKDCLEDLRWELVEECSKEELSEKEKYWIEFYGGKGWNMR